MAAGDEANKQKQCRSKAPRVRTGCITCKARHVKCDETKPTCRRCQQDRRTCDGYKTLPRLKPGPKPKPKANSDCEANILLLQQICKDAGLGRTLLPRRQPSASMQPNDIHAAMEPWLIKVPRVLPERLFINDRDPILLNHAQLFLLDQVASVSDPADFWHSYAMPLAHIATPLNYAFCALGAAHRHFLFSGPGENGSRDEILRSEIIAIEKYNAAIAQIQDYARQDHRGIDAHLPLICCVVFMCIEQLLGRYEESVRHLKAGCGLLRSSSELPATSAPRDLSNAVLKVFYQFSNDAAFYNGENVLGDLPFDYPTPDLGNRYEPFASYEEASSMLQRVDVIYNVSFASPVIIPEHQPSECCWLEMQETRALSSAREAFHIWNARFKLLQQSDIPAPEQRPEDLSFALEQSVWTLVTELTTFDDAVSIESAQKVLSNAESVALMYQSQKHPSFTLGGDLLPALTLICMSCEDRETQLRGVSVLRSLRRREGVWDSRELADECETYVLTGETPW